MALLQVEIYKVLLLASISISLFIAISLFIKKSTNNLFRILGVFLISMLVLPIHAYIDLTAGNIPLFITAAAHSFILLYSPTIYLFLKLLVDKNNLLKQKNLIGYFIPFALLFSLKLSQVPYNTNIIVSTISFIILTYMVMNLKLIIKHKEQLKLLVKQYTYTSYYWLIYIVVALQLLIFFDLSLIISFVFSLGITTTYWHNFTLGISLYLLTFSALFVYGSSIYQIFIEGSSNEQAQPAQTIKEEDTSTINQAASSTEDSNNELSPELVTSLTKQLNELIQVQQPHLHNSLSLTDLATLMGLSNAHLSELLNKHIGSSFYVFINNMRFNTAMSLINNPDCQLSMLDIAYHAGFNNKNTFYRVFKEKTGKTPKQQRTIAMAKYTSTDVA